MGGFKKMVPLKTNVIRNGKKKRVDVSQITVGDLGIHSLFFIYSFFFFFILFFLFILFFFYSFNFFFKNFFS